MVDAERVSKAFQTASQDLLDQRHAQGHWIGELSSSALSTATAISAISVAKPEQVRTLLPNADQSPEDLVTAGIAWLAAHQNRDGGWGDTDQSFSNIATTMLVVAAFRLAGAAANHAAILDRAESYIRGQGGIAGLKRRYGRDKTFAVPILMNCALAGMVPWSDVAPLPFELACFPQSWFRLLRLPVVSYAIPALVAVGQARYFHLPPRNPFARRLRAMAVEGSRRLLERMQPASGGFLEATPLTSFVVMGLAGIGQAAHPVTKLGLEFLVRSVRPDGSWPIDTNLATWLTTLSLRALVAGGRWTYDSRLVEWVLACQHLEKHPFTAAEPGGWGWSDLSGAVPDADDTAGALLALSHVVADAPPDEARRIRQAAVAGLGWLVRLQNGDGGWPTFCRGWGKLPFDRSGTDLTAHALRAMAAWLKIFQQPATGRGSSAASDDAADWLPQRPAVDRAIQRGLAYLQRTQAADGSWAPLWFGNQFDPREENPVYGTSRVLAAFCDLGLAGSRCALRAAAWLVARQNPDGGWGGHRPQFTPQGEHLAGSSVEETALALDALLTAEPAEVLKVPIDKALSWLCTRVEQGRHHECSPIGFYFAKLWYYEKLYPLIFTVAALGRAAGQSGPGSGHQGASALGTLEHHEPTHTT
ncbi:MAG TPA: prenyltransferase/squalene oxidase repeat-containing protein [Pirellulales bacterium]|jgi:squalene-hopene/tetraprenyl-beta-curcumene cyclase|nr:prenyltransferase/squalene oxidase repeat-containing protein [Pirellulales bacterium]